MAGLDQLYAEYRPGWTLARPFYRDGAIFEAEAGRIFRRSWLFAGHECQIPRPGDYFTVDAGGDSIIVIRTEEGDVNALFNTCRHRGSKICTEERGQAKRLVCPYHRWAYDTDGALIAARGLPAEVDRSSLGLHRAAVRLTGGLIFICAAGEPPDFDSVEAEFSALLDPHDLAGAKIAHTVEYELPANWKLVVENHRECYHCPTAHKEYSKIHYDTRLTSAAWVDEIEARTEACRTQWAALGLDTENVTPASSFTGAWWRANRTAFPAGHVTESPDGKPVAPLMGEFTEADMGTARAGTYPNFWMHATGDHAATMRLTPAGPESTWMRADWLVRADAVEGVDYEVERLIAFSDRVNREDRDLILGQAAGVSSSRYAPGPLVREEESRVQHFLDWYIAMMKETL
jgi:Rieske 2Fe-2S family protein